MNELEIVAQIGDLKELDYQNTLAIASIIELLIEKKVITQEELAKKAHGLDQISFIK
ncbi:hypothetical protein [Alkaliphilus crotonatoxidans]